MEQLHETAKWRPHWTIKKYLNDAEFDKDNAYEVVEIDGNLLLNVGINDIWAALAGALATPFNNANARIGVGDSSTAAAAGQTGLQAATNKTYVGMNATYPTRGSQQIVFQSNFGGSQANYAWNEFIVDNGTDALNRLVSAQGTKVSGQTWQVTLTITLS